MGKPSKGETKRLRTGVRGCGLRQREALAEGKRGDWKSRMEHGAWSQRDEKTRDQEPRVGRSAAEAQRSNTPKHRRYFPCGGAQAVTADAQGPIEFGIICCRV